MNALTKLGKMARDFGLGVAALLVLIAVAVLPGVVMGQAAPQGTPVPLVAQPLFDARGGQLSVPQNKSHVVRVDQPFTDLSVGNPAVADVVALSDRSIYVLGKALGSTNLTIYGPGRRILSVIDLTVTHDVEGLKGKLFELFPSERIEVRAAGDSVVLGGTLSSPDQLAHALSIAERYAPGKVTNLLRVRGSQQVMLQVRVAEVSRTIARQLGIRPQVLSSNFVFQPLDLVDPNAFATLLGVFEFTDFTINALIEALEEKGVVKVLAEPNLLALSGETANFLAGGEFPVPVAQDVSGSALAITVEFKQFGVSLAFTPTVVDGEVINLVVNPEVSQIDPTTSVVLNGFSIPGLSTRRATTTVELRDGQSFAIAGLLESNFQDQVRQLPGIGNLPVLGALFRSSEYLRSETELVIIVTPRLVRPVAAGSLMSPTDTFRAPSQFELFLLGRTESSESGTVPAASPRAALGAGAGGGLEGTFGHIIK